MPTVVAMNTFSGWRWTMARKHPNKVFKAKQVKNLGLNWFFVGNGMSYRLHELIGKGGFGQVYRATCLATGDDVAVKVIRKSELRTRIMVERVRAEADIHSQLKHDNVLELFKCFEDGECVYLVLELCIVGDLNSYLKRNTLLTDTRSFGPICFCELLDSRRLFTQILRGVMYLHANGYIHRDINTNNILLTDSLNAKICDFGMATELSGQTQRMKTVCGTVSAMPPEMLRAKNGYNSKAEVWSLGILLYTLLAGYAPFDARTVQNTVKNIRSAQVDFPTCVGASARSLILEMLDKEASRRPDLESVAAHPFLRAYTIDAFTPKRGSILSGGGSTLSHRESAPVDSTNCDAPSSNSRVLPERMRQFDKAFRFTSSSRDDQHFEPPDYRLAAASRRSSAAAYDSVDDGYRSSSATRPPTNHDRLSGDFEPRVSRTASTDRHTDDFSALQLSHRSGANRVNRNRDHHRREPDPLLSSSRASRRASFVTSPPYDTDCPSSDTNLPDRSDVNSATAHSRKRTHPSRSASACNYRSDTLDSHRNSRDFRQNENDDPCRSFQNSCDQSTARNSCGLYGREPFKAVGNVQRAVGPSRSSETRNDDIHVADTIHGGAGSARDQRSLMRDLSQLKRTEVTQSPEYQVSSLDSRLMRLSTEPSSPTSCLGSTASSCRSSASPLPPFSTNRLRPFRQKLKEAIVHILSSGAVVAEFLKGRADGGEMVMQVVRVSSDSEQIAFYHPKPPPLVTSTEPVLLSDEEPSRQYTRDTLPDRFRKKFSYISRFVSLVRSKSPKVSFYAHSCKAMLMEDRSFFEAHFYTGAKVRRARENITLIAGAGVTMTVGFDSGGNPLDATLSSDHRELVSESERCYDKCRAIEECMEKLSLAGDKDRDMFPVVVGRRPTK